MTSAGVDLLERAIGYALVSMDAVTPGLLSRPTPCAGWDLDTLVRHLNDSVGVLREGIEARRVSPMSTVDIEGGAAVFRVRAHQLLSAWITAGLADVRVSVAEIPLPACVIAVTGAVEIVVHGWDIGVACGQRRPIPPALAADLLPVSPLIATGALRRGLFAPAVPVSPLASPGDRLLAFLGRDPSLRISVPPR